MPIASVSPAVTINAALRRKLAMMVVIGFALRVGFVLIAHTYRFKSADSSFGFGFEMGRIAASLAQGHGFSSPFQIPTGPTAWEPPLYPFLIAAIFKLTGIYTHASAVILLTINSFFSSLTSVPVFYLARRSFGEKIANWSAWSWALCPYAMYWAVKWVWETSIAAFLLALLLLMAFRLTEDKSAREWAAWGFLWGLAALLNPTLLSVLPFAGTWIVLRRWQTGRKVLVYASLSALIFAATIAPWLLRNFRTFGQPIFLRSNFGAELRFGNGPAANGLSMGFELHPTHNPAELERYRKIGELAYVAEKKNEALNWIKSNPAEFIHVSFARFVYYWTDTPWSGRFMPAKNALFLASSIGGFWGLWLMWRQRRHGFFLFAACMLIFPIVYYFVFPHPRYRAPIEPELFTLVVFLISQTKELRSRL